MNHVVARLKDYSGQVATGLRILAVCFAAATASAGTAQASELSLIIHRGEKSIEIFAAMPMQTAVGALGLDTELLAGPNGEVDFWALRETHWLVGDELFKDVAVSQAGEPMPLEAMALMVHPEDDPIPFSTPIDGYLAVSVCTAPLDADNLPLDHLTLYTGLIGFPDEPMDPLTLTLPLSDETPDQVFVYDYFDGALKHKGIYAVPEDGTIALPGVPKPHTMTAGAVALLTIGLLGGAAVWRLRPSAKDKDA
ncbi:MAG: hypothetical protein AAGG56_13340 [Pseudomonadota bacterium]